jgi:thymidylate synthase (FAD)
MRPYNKTMGGHDPLGDEVSSVERLDVTHGDLSVVNAARVSMNKFHTKIDSKDTGLINFLAKHRHWTPFSHSQFLVERTLSVGEFIKWCCDSEDYQFSRVVIESNDKNVVFLERGTLFAYVSNGIVTEEMHKLSPISCKAFGHDIPTGLNAEDSIIDITHLIEKPEELQQQYLITMDDADKLCIASFRIKMPIFVARQWFKHQIGFSRNEVSRRYVDDTPEFFNPTAWRGKAENVKQGSIDGGVEDSQDLNFAFGHFLENTTSMYTDLIEHQICAEQSRMILPQAMYTEFVETASIKAYKRLVGLRMDAHAQLETKLYAKNIGKALDILDEL